MQKILVVGSLNMDYVINVPKLPVPGETIMGTSFNMVPGGKGANQAYTLGRIGAQVAMVGAVGKDEAGEKLLSNLKSVGVDISGISCLDTVGTGKAFIEVDAQAQNHIIVIAGSNSCVTPEMVAAAKPLFSEADAVVLQLEIPLPTVCAAAKLAKQLGKTVILDPAPAVSNLPEELIRLADIMKPNETELAILTGMHTDSKEHVEQAAQTLLARGAKNIIVSLGGDGAMLVNDQGTQCFDAVPVKAVDTTAAGDCFTAAFTSRFTGNNYAEAITFAMRVAAIAVTRAGAQSSIPSLEEIKVMEGVH